ncbi:MAG: hypothetical protein F2772_12135 [Actinobacteria bacterium]|nr:hypothetical protein [Actinomycetota bacterium]
MDRSLWMEEQFRALWLVRLKKRRQNASSPTKDAATCELNGQFAVFSGKFSFRGDAREKSIGD